MSETLPQGPGPSATTILFQQESEQLLGGAQLQKTVEIGAQTDLSGVYFQTRLPAQGYIREGGQSTCDALGGLIEDILTVPDVVALSYVQDVNAAGQLLDNVEVFWQLPDGTASGSFTQPLGLLYREYVVPKIVAAEKAYT